MSDIYDYLADVVRVIREDSELRSTFNRILGAGHGDQRVAMLLTELAETGAPEQVMMFVKLLNDDRVADIVLKEINR